MSDKTKHMPSDSLFDEVMRITRQHFDEDAPEYVTRFLKAHLQKSPELLTADDLISLIHWIRTFVAFLEESKGAGEQYITDLLELIPPDRLVATDEDQ